MNTVRTPENYLLETGKRLRGRTLAAGIGIVLGVAIIVTAFSAALFLRTGYDESLVTLARLTLLALLLVSAIATVWWPLRRLTRDRLVSFLERANPALDGRLRTWSEVDASQPMTPLLAADAAQRCAERPPAELIPAWQLHTARAAAIGGLLLLLGALLLAPPNWRFGAQHLWFGWLPGDRTPPQQIAVQPGDTTIKQGSNQIIRAVSQGFLPDQAILHAEFDGEWQQVPMQRTADDAFEFTLYGVVQPVDYYVSAVGVNSPGYTIDVIAMPTVENVRVDYRYPEWTGLEPTSETPAARIRAVGGTEVQLTFETDRPMNRPELVISGEAMPLDSGGTVASGTFTLVEDGEYFLVDYLGDEAIRISDTWPIIAVEDSRPTIQAVYPGRDWDATNIEEIPLQFEAEDDFGIQSVVLHYSVNGGAWQQTALQLDEAGVSVEEMLMLEEIRSIDTPVAPSPFQPLGSERQTPAAIESEANDDEPKPLVPGDVISYYAEVRDRELSAQTDILFIDVQPFERRFSQSQQAGGGAAGAAGNTGNDNQELAERQREIVVATWNLIRAENGQQTTSAPIDVGDNSKMLGTLQSTLEEQTRTLADRARARQLDASDPLIAEFVENLDLAAEAMMPAADLLTDVALNDSLQPQQKALQHLMRADALFQDISVSQQQPGGGGGGGGGGAASDLAEIYELEMDLEKNQYETRDPINMQEQGPEQALDDSLDLLDELARRQQQLADAAQRNAQMSAAERWQQEQLQRELEELQERLEQMQQQQASESGQQSGAASAASQSLQEAIDSLNQANQQSQAGGDPEAMREAMEQAEQQLDRAREQLAQERQQQIGESFEQLAERAESLFDQQEEASSRLQEALQTSIAERESGVNRFSSGLSYDEETELAELKREMAQELADIREQMDRTAARAADAMPESADTLQEAREALDEEDVIGQLNEAALDIENGYAPYAAVREVLTTTALNNLRFQLQQAERLAQSETQQPGELAGQPGQPSAEEQIRQLRLALEAGAQGNAGGDPNAAGGNPTAAAGGADGGVGRGAAGPLLDRTPLDWTLPEGGLGVRPDAETIRQLPAELLGLTGPLVDAGIDPNQLSELQALARSLANQNPERLDSILSEEYERMIGLLEKMELALANEGARNAPVALGSERERLGDEDEVADYFRRLSEQ